LLAWHGSIFSYRSHLGIHPENKLKDALHVQGILTRFPRSERLIASTSIDRSIDSKSERQRRQLWFRPTCQEPFDETSC
jgi:hypothetical protein